MRKLLAVSVMLIVLLGAATAFATPNSDLIENGSFDATAAGELPDGWYFDAWLKETSDAALNMDNGRTGMAVHIINYIENDVRLCRNIEVEGNSYYRISCYIKTAGVTGGAGANISVADTLAASTARLNDSDWEYVELIGKTEKKQNSIVVCLRIGGYGALSLGEAWFDDFNVVKLDNKPMGEVADFSKVEYQAQQQPEQGKMPYIGAIVLTPLLFIVVFIMVYKRLMHTSMAVHTKNEEYRNITIILCASFLLRCLLSLTIYGHPTDIQCFMSWSNALVENGLSSFYTSGMFADYTPGYMYVLWLTGAISKLLGFAYGDAGYVLLTKLPAILADIMAAYVVYKLARKRFSYNVSMLLMLFCAFNPVMAFVSGGWGQIDQVLAVLLLATIYLFVEKKQVLAGLIYGLAILVKPQALMIGPLMAVAYVLYIHDNGWKGLLKTIAAVLSAVGVIWLLSLPFKSTQEPLWIVNKYFDTASSYPYASVEAYNLFALFGGNWANINSTFLIFSYGQWGTVLMGAAVVFTAILYIYGRKAEPHCLMLCAGYLLCALFIVGQYMHERYMFPALLLLLVAFIFYNDKRLYLTYGFLSASLLLNVLGAFVIVSRQDAREGVYNALTYIGSLLNIMGYGYFTYVCCDIIFKKRRIPVEKQTKAATVVQAEKLEYNLPQPVDNKLHYTKKDRLYCIALTAIYAVVALVNLGTLQAPQTTWYGNYGDVVSVELEDDAVLSDIWIFGGMYTGSITITADDGTTIDYKQDNGDMFRWISIGGSEVRSKSFTIEVTDGSVWINELAFFGADGKLLSASASSAIELTDEPDQIPDHMSYINGMYFDELYHARTAYEHLHGIQPYENSHPPLGKVFIMLGIAIFGMNAFGWRIIGTLFGIGMVPVMYAFAKRLFKRSEYALLVSVLFAFDFMHFTQTRIATIDVYGVFFIILMFYYMYQYYCMNFYVDGLKKTLKPLSLAGVFFGLGAASKWICIYAGFGLAALLTISLIKRYIEYRRFKNSADAGAAAAVAPFYKYLILTLLWCCVFYIAVPVGIYLLAYMPYYLCQNPYDVKGVWEVQKFMFSYHSGLTDTHPYESPWWQWPLNLRPMWYYVGYDTAAGNISTISAMGNPAVWWPCLVGTIALMIQLLRGKLKNDDNITVLLIGIAANYVPWVLVPRCTFVYHYFATVPFIILCTVYMLKRIEETTARHGWIKWAWMGLAIAMFILFYPVISGAECSRKLVNMLEWLPTWTFMGK